MNLVGKNSYQWWDMASRSKITDEKLAEMERLAEMGMSLRGIALRVGVDISYLSRALSQGKDSTSKSLRRVYNALSAGYSKCEERLLQIIWGAALGKRIRDAEKTPQWTAAARILEALGIWRRRDEEGEPIEHKHITIEIKEIPIRKVDGEDNSE